MPHGLLNISDLVNPFASWLGPGHLDSKKHFKKGNKYLSISKFANKVRDRNWRLRLSEKEFCILSKLQWDLDLKKC